MSHNTHSGNAPKYRGKKQLQMSKGMETSYRHAILAEALGSLIKYQLNYDDYCFRDNLFLTNYFSLFSYYHLNVFNYYQNYL